MLPKSIAEQLCAKGYDVHAVVSNPAFASLPDEEILIGAAEAGRSLVTADIRDFMALDARFRATGRSHAGLILISTKTFPQDRSFVRAVISALAALLAREDGLTEGRVLFLARQ